ncbi:hypothetical protein TW95_gp0994 [Pandoravirus inopinatum]|uniref:Uncharacterized protein n=1 Tax=Pandoravirus inopinatum TaxID=1605721 RepID=A0A0B5IY36_9VIRU|nr:hypothetical protein TW95_gp0994 [Pandoravirus inopinatum]AJF97728.1 hypothetical protein [Pandoravirus inopinatum]
MEDDYADNETTRLCAVIDASPEDDTAARAINDVGDDDNNDNNDGGTDVAPYGYAGYGNYYEALQAYDDDDNDGYKPTNGVYHVDEDTGEDAVPADIGDLLPTYSPDDDGECADQDLGSDRGSDDTYDLAFDAFYAASLVAPLGDEQDVVSLGQRVSDAAIAYPDDYNVDDDLGGDVGGDDDPNGYLADQPVDATDYTPEATPPRADWPLDVHPFAAYIDDAVDSDDDDNTNDNGVVIGDRTWHDDMTDANDWPVKHLGSDDSTIAHVAPTPDGHDNNDDNDTNAVPIAPSEGTLDDHLADLCVPSTGPTPIGETHPDDLVADASETGAGISHVRHSHDYETAPVAAAACPLAQNAPADVAVADTVQGVDGAVVDDQTPAQTVNSSDDALAVESAVDIPGDDSDDQKAIAAFAPIAVVGPSPGADEADDTKAMASFEPITTATACVEPSDAVVEAPVVVTEVAVAVVEASVTAVVEPEPVAAPPVQTAAPTPAEAASWWSPWSWWSGKSASAGTASAASDARLKAPGWCSPRPTSTACVCVPWRRAARVPRRWPNPSACWANSSGSLAASPVPASPPRASTCRALRRCVPSWRPWRAPVARPTEVSVELLSPRPPDTRARAKSFVTPAGHRRPCPAHFGKEKATTDLLFVCAFFDAAKEIELAGKAVLPGLHIIGSPPLFLRKEGNFYFHLFITVFISCHAKKNSAPLPRKKGKKRQRACR